MRFLALLLLPLLLSAQERPHVVQDPPLAPEVQQKKFRLPPGFEIQLVAAEPDVRKPLNLVFDDRGRLFVTQSVEYPFPAKEGAVPRDVVKRLEDFGPDGRARRVTTFADGLNIPIGLLPVGREVLVHSIPKIYRCADRDGDGKAEARVPLYGDFGFADTHGMASSFTRGLDGWVYATHGFHNTSKVRGADGHELTMRSGNTFRFRADGSRVEIFSHGQVNPFGLSFDARGDLYSADCHSLPAYLLQRGGCYPTFDGKHDGLGMAPAIMSHQHGSSAIAGIVVYEAEHFPAAYRGTVFVGNPMTGRINHDRLEPRGSAWKAAALPDFLRCDDPWFRPVALQLAPDGSLYIADFYNCIIGHYEVPLDHPKRDRERGRIWRVVYTGPDGGPLRPMPDLAAAPADDLIGLLKNPNLVVRFMATNRLADRAEAVEPLRKLLAGDSHSFQRAHGLWVLERLKSLDEGLVRKLARDPEALVRGHLLRALAERPGWGAAEYEAARGLLRDADFFVRRVAADALGRHPQREGWRPLLEAWEGTPSPDPHLVHSFRMALRDHLKEIPALFGELGPHPKLADVSLGVKSPESAHYVLACLEAGAAPAGALHHAARHVEEARLPAVVALARKLGGNRLAHARALLQGLQERGAPVPAEVAAWAAEAVRKGLAGDAAAALKLVQDVRLKGLHAELAPLAEKASAHRAAAIKALAVQDAAQAVPVLARILAHGSDPGSIRQEASQALASINTPGARQALAEQLKTAPGPLAAHIASGLAQSREGGELLLSAVGEGKASPRLLRERTVAERLRGSGLHDRAAKLAADLPPEDERLAKLLAGRRDAFRKQSPDVAAGRKAFEKHCAGCHRLDGQGNKIGPDLDGIGARGLERLLEDVLDPNRNVDQAFRASVLRLTDGRVLSGLVLREEGEILVLQEAVDKETRVPLKEIERRALSTLSPMPANFADAIPEPDFHALLAYLLAARK